MRAAGFNKRSLAQAFAEKTKNKPESERRAIYDYIGGVSEPEPERAAELAVILKDPQLALVSVPADRRSARRAELEARLTEMERLLNEVAPRLDQVAARVDALETRSRPKRATGD